LSASATRKGVRGSFFSRASSLKSTSAEPGRAAALTSVAIAAIAAIREIMMKLAVRVAREQERIADDGKRQESKRPVKIVISFLNSRAPNCLDQHQLLRQLNPVRCSVNVK
jgi:hypothetical protein